MAPFMDTFCFMNSAKKRVIIGTLRNIVKKARTAKLVAPAVFVVGKVVKLRKKILGSMNKKSAS